MKKLLCLFVLFGFTAEQVVLAQTRDGRGRPSRRDRTSRERPPQGTRDRDRSAADRRAPRDGRELILCPYGVTKGWCGPFVESYCPPGFVCAINSYIDDPYGVCCRNVLSNTRGTSSRRRQSRTRSIERGSRRRTGFSESSDRGLTSNRRRPGDRRRKPNSRKRKTRVISGSANNGTVLEKLQKTGSQDRKRGSNIQRQTSEMQDKLNNVTNTQHSLEPAGPLMCSTGKLPLVGKCGGRVNLTCPNSFTCVLDERDSSSYGICCRL